MLYANKREIYSRRRRPLTKESFLQSLTQVRRRMAHSKNAQENILRK